MDALFQDVRYAVRTLAKNPGFTAVAVLTLALGIGANTAIFTLVNAILLRPPVGLGRPAQLVLVGRTVGGEGFDTFSYPDFHDLRDRARTVSLAAFSEVPMHLSTGGASERIRGALVSGDYFRVLGMRPARGRFFAAEEDRPGNPRGVAVITDGLWRRRFGARPDIVGSTLALNGRPFTVIGLTPAGFHGPTVGSELSVFVPLAAQPLAAAAYGDILPVRAGVWLQLLGRLRPGATLEGARAELSTLSRQLVAAFPDIHKHWGIVVAPGVSMDPFTRRRITSFFGLLLGAAGLVLAIACANVANLLLARASGRRRELAVRVSLGAGRGRLVRQLLTESLVLSLAGATLGVAFAFWSGDLLRGLPLLSQEAVGLDLTPDARALAFASVTLLVSGVLFGLPPAFQVSRPDLVSELKDARGSGRPAGHRLRRLLVITQLAVSIVLLIGAGLLVRTLRMAYAIDPGFAAGGVVVARLDLGMQGYDSLRGAAFYDALLNRLAHAPGVASASLALNVPFGGGFDTRIAAQGQTVSAEHPGERTDRNTVTPDYFRTMGIPIVRGRGFTARDVATAPHVVLINEAIADRLWPGQDPLGKRLLRTWGGEPLEVIGVVKDAKYRSLFEPRRLTFYQPLAQDYQPAIIVHARADGDPRAIERLMPRLAAELDRDLPVYRVQTLADRLDDSLGQQRLGASLVGAFGLMALVLAAIGLYAALAYTVAQRTREIGVRMALGARAADVLRQVLVEAAGLAALGVGTGLVGALAATRVLKSQLYGVTPTDPASFGAVVVLLAVVALVAAYLPARRATRVDPMVALRSE